MVMPRIAGKPAAAQPSARGSGRGSRGNVERASASPAPSEADNAAIDAKSRAVDAEERARERVIVGRA
jgi:hypothetical protein